MAPRIAPIALAPVLQGACRDTSMKNIRAKRTCAQGGPRPRTGQRGCLICMKRGRTGCTSPLSCRTPPLIQDIDNKKKGEGRKKGGGEGGREGGKRRTSWPRTPPCWS